MFIDQQITISEGSRDTYCTVKNIFKICNHNIFSFVKSTL